MAHTLPDQPQPELVVTPSVVGGEGGEPAGGLGGALGGLAVMQQTLHGVEVQLTNETRLPTRMQVR